MKSYIKYVIPPVVFAIAGSLAHLIDWKVAGTIGLIAGILITINNAALVKKAAEKINL